MSRSAGVMITLLLAMSSAYADDTTTSPELRSSDGDDVEACGLRGYLEPSAFLAVATRPRVADFVEPTLPSNRGALLHRVSAGGQFRRCRTGEPSLGLRVGLTAATSNLRPRPGIVGVEIGGDRALARKLRIGFEAGGELGGGARSLRLGVRARYADLLWFGVDLVDIATTDMSRASCESAAVFGCSAPLDGVLVGAGLEGKLGSRATLVEAGVGAIVGVVFLVIAAGSV